MRAACRPWARPRRGGGYQGRHCIEVVHVLSRHPAWGSGRPPGRVCAGATMYVTLEPCCTYGRTPPCTEALMAGGLRSRRGGGSGSDPQVNGRGLEILRAAGMQVDLADGTWPTGERQNDGLRKVIATGLPFVTYKYAMTLDGRVATDSGDSRWISGAESRALVHQWRSWSDAVVVGAGTVKRDDPRLTAREVACARQPLRVVVDGGSPCVGSRPDLRDAEGRRGPRVLWHRRSGRHGER